VRPRSFRVDVEPKKWQRREVNRFRFRNTYTNNRRWEVDDGESLAAQHFHRIRVEEKRKIGKAATIFVLIFKCGKRKTQRKRKKMR